jgi:ABC-type polysaccharide/polyol phosphate export permease
MYSLDNKWFQKVGMLSPMAVIVTGYRNSLLGQSQPGLVYVALAAAVSVTVFVIGAMLFRQAKPAFADVL